MARYLKSISGYNDPVDVEWRVAASQTINVGDLVQLNTTSRMLEVAVAASTTLAGIAQESIVTGATVTSGDKINITPLTGLVARIAFVGTTKTTLATTDMATTLFDLSSKVAMNLDDVTGGMCSVVGYNNTNKTADVVFAAANVVRL